MSRQLSQRMSRSLGVTSRDKSDIFASVNHNRPRSLPLPNPLYRPSLEEVREGGEIIYRTFIGEELEDEVPQDEAHIRARREHRFMYAEGGLTEGVEQLRLEVLLPILASTPEGFNASYFARTGRALKELADDFARSMEGRRVRERADDVPLSSITEERFINLLYKVFLKGFSRERLIALFTYCSRILVRALRAKAYGLAMNLFRWSLEYIRNQVAPWVYQQGGWEKVLWSIPWVRIMTIGLTVIGISAVLGAFYLYIL